MENMIKENTLCKRKSSEVYAECAAEYILPDYKGDVKRILHIEAQALPSGSFSDSEETELAGVAAFDVLYLDAENKLTSVSFSTDYSLRVPMKDGVSAVFAEQTAENANVRLPGPRKMLARCTVKGAVKGEYDLACEAEGSTFSEESMPEVCKCSVSTGHILRGKLKDREYAEEFFFLPGAALDDIEISAKRGEIKINSVSAKDGRVNVSGEINIYAIVKSSETSPYTKEMKIPFDESVEIAEVNTDCETLAGAEIVSLECSMNPEDDGVRVNASVIIDIEAKAYKNENAEFVTDAFSPVGEVENKYESIRYEEFIGARRSASRISREIPKSETDAECATDIIYLSTDVKIGSIRTENSCVTVDGEVRFSGVACENYEDGTPTYTSVKFSVPFSEGVNFNTQIPAGAITECNASSFDASVSIDENNFYAECGICLSVGVFAERETERLVSSDLLPLPCEKKPPSVISVYYPEEGDTLFGVAKKFKTSPAKIAEDNALTEEAMSKKDSLSSLISVGKLIIKNS